MGGDAPCDLLASDDYVQQAELLRLELQRRSAKTFSDVEWRRTNTMIHVNSIMMSIVVALLARCIHTERA